MQVSEGIEKVENQSVPKWERELKASFSRERKIPAMVPKKRKGFVAETE